MLLPGRRLVRPMTQKKQRRFNLWRTLLLLVTIFLLGIIAANHCFMEPDPVVTLPIRPIVGRDQHSLHDNDALPHPHAGARFEDGRLGLVVDPSPSRMIQSGDRPWPCPNPIDPGVEGKGGRQILEKVRKGVINSQRSLATSLSGGENLPRILCMVYTHEGAHDSSLTAIANTWGRHCDGFFAASTKTNHSIGAIHLLHRGPEEYDNMWQKIRSMWAYAHDNYLDQYDYFHICGDDVYVVVENLRAYLHSNEVKRLEEGHLDVFSAASKVARNTAMLRPRPLLFGMPVEKLNKHKYPLGGPGYTLNSAAVELLVKKGLPNYRVNVTDPREDVFVGKFFASQGVLTTDTRDAKGSWRYGENAERHASLSGNVLGFWEPKKMKKKYPKLTYWENGVDFLSSQTVSFHLKLARGNTTAADLIYRYDEILHRNDSSCRASTK